MCCFRLTINKILWRYLKIEKKNGLIYQLNWFSLGGKLPDIMGCKLPAWTLLFNWKCVIFLMRYWIYENVGKLRKMIQKIYRYKSVTQTWWTPEACSAEGSLTKNLYCGYREFWQALALLNTLLVILMKAGFSEHYFLKYDNTILFVPSK